jgi:hypothetical protein
MKRGKGLCVLLVLCGVLVWLLRREPAREPNTLSPGDVCWSQASAWCSGAGGWCDLQPTSQTSWRAEERDCFMSCWRPYIARCLKYRSMEVATEEEYGRLLDGIRTVQTSWRD